MNSPLPYRSVRLSLMQGVGPSRMNDLKGLDGR